MHGNTQEKRQDLIWLLALQAMPSSLHKNHVQLPVSQSVWWMFDVGYLTMVEIHIALLTIACSYCFEFRHLHQLSILVIPDPWNSKYCLMYKPSLCPPRARLQNFSPIHVKPTNTREHTYTCTHACMHTQTCRVTNNFILKKKSHTTGSVFA